MNCDQKSSQLALRECILWLMRSKTHIQMILETATPRYLEFYQGTVVWNKRCALDSRFVHC